MQPAVAAPRPVLFAPVRAALASFEEPHFRLYWFNSAFFFIGQGLIQIGAQWLMLTLTDSRSMLGALSAVQGVVVIGLSPVGGVVCDRLNRRDILIVVRVGFALLMGAMGVLVATGNVQVWHLFLSVGLAGLLLAFSQAATQTYIRDIVGTSRLTNAIALNAMATGIFQVAGPALGGTILAAIGSQGTYLVGAGGYLAGALFLMRIPIPGRPGAVQRKGSVWLGTWRDLRDGVRYIAQDRLLPWFFLVTMCGFFGSSFFVMRPVFAKEILNVGASGLGWLGACFGVGTLLGALLIAGVGPRLKYLGAGVLVGQLIWNSMGMLYSQSHWYGLNLGIEVVQGMASTLWASSALTALQVVVPQQFQNRVLSVHFMILGFSNVAWWVTGVIADAFGDRQALFIMGACSVSVCIPMMLLNRRMMTLGSKRNPLASAEARAALGL